MANDLVYVSIGDIVTAERQNDITDYIHLGLHKINTQSVDIRDVNVIDYFRNWTGNPIALSKGGTGSDNQIGALRNLLPNQIGNSGKYLSTDGNAPYWVSANFEDKFVRVSDTDTTSGYLLNKIIAGNGINIIRGNAGSNEILTIVNTNVIPETNITAGVGIQVLGSFPNYQIVNTGIANLVVKNINPGSPYVPQVHTIEFDEGTGLQVESPSSGVARIKLGSHWKDLVIAGQPTLSPTGEETLEFKAGAGITLTSSQTSTPQSITITGSGVPYTGASANVDLGDKSLTASSFLFDSETGWYYDSVNSKINMSLIKDSVGVFGYDYFDIYDAGGGANNFERRLESNYIFGEGYPTINPIRTGFNIGPENYYHYFLMNNISLRSDTGLNVFGATIDSSGNIAGTNLSGTNTGDQVGDGVTITGAGTILDPFVANVPTASVNGGVFITNIVPQSTGNVSEKVFSNDGYVLDSCLTSTNLVTLSVMAISGNTNYIPVVKVNDEPVTLVGDNTTPLFTGTINVDLNDAESITVVHEDGAEHTVSIDYEDTPVISSVEFIGDYPGSQTELKAGDTFSLRVQSTTNFTQIYVYDYGACVEQTETFTATNDKTITITIADRGTSLQALTGKVKIINSNGTSSADAETSNTLNLNNLYPTVNITTITYPASQGALKDSETATVENSLSNYNSVVYSSGNSQLSITNPTTYESPKTVTRIAGDYNIDTNNLTITATRTANNAVTASSTIIKIAHTSPTIAITLPQARLRSGGNDGTAAQNYVVTLTATQELLQAPTLDLGAEGTWVGAGFSGSGTTWTRNIQVHDDDVKGSYDFNNLIAYNLAGKEVNSINSGATYTLGGFVSRAITLEAFANEATMNVAAVTYSKVSMTWSVKSLTNKRDVGTTTVPDPNSWCLHSLETNPTIIRILDTEATNSSSQSSTLTIQETV